MMLVFIDGVCGHDVKIVEPDAALCRDGIGKRPDIPHATFQYCNFKAILLTHVNMQRRN